jgi:hypothetical protein
MKLVETALVEIKIIVTSIIHLMNPMKILTVQSLKKKPRDATKVTMRLHLK